MHNLKILGSIVLVLALIIGASFFASRILATSTLVIEEKILKTEANIYEKNWEPAKNNLLEIIEKWPETEKKWSILLDHSDIDAISTSISRLSVYIDAKDSTLALAEIASLKQLLKTIPDREALSLTNIF
ncbi:MAG TPA: DUF4363 domain-containing protein [Ruminiclostridium sp.]|jgi:hypothetical protein|uniref:DUF4363 family protein n=1 Tax=Acetivibrio saccincola TaxID=1677857 RepID=A0A2K9EAA7_9FIRM|nr:DUF4363 family protein [Acetivibrio saccincola]HAA43632.1 DUF4363 domain-containing protein [Ruminiclostridium sp.]AUG57034.1 hypothetical protein HVS_05520 [Acetivibrio saccincola]NLW25922.1 DUF4363 family protein [Acetivibrio saccincola]PQQ67049.1 hypothetical protein B9R14_10070 [Acetivibrio saccincola]HOA98103.1 DUF4363 family protein [Acetivibrio saccincola]